MKAVQPGLIGRERLLRNHVSNQHYEDIIRKRFSFFPEIPRLFNPAWLGRIREKIGGLPAFLHRFEERFNMFANKSLNALYHFNS